MIAATFRRTRNHARLLLTLALLVAAAPLAGFQPQNRPGGPPSSGFPGLPGAPGLRGGAGGQEALESSTQVVTVSAVPARRTLIPGDAIPVAVTLDIRDGWHLWSSMAQATALPDSYGRFDGAVYTAIDVDDPKSALNVATSFIQWPQTHAITADIGDGSRQYAVFEGRAVAFVPVIVPIDTAPGPQRVTLALSVQACNDRSCLMPGDLTVSFDLEIVGMAGVAQGGIGDGAGTRGAGDAGSAATGAGASGVPGGATDPALFTAFDPAVFGRIAAGEGGFDPNAAIAAASDDTRVHFNLFVIQFSIDPNGFGRVLLLGIMFLSGLLLNLTPCVLPIIPLKIIGLTQSAGSRGRTLLLGAIMGLGVLSFFLAIGLAMAVLKVDAVNIIFQYPLVTIGIGVFIILMAVAMGGFFNFRLPEFVYAFEPKHETARGSFFVGIVTAVLSTPCGAPLVLSSVSYALKVDSRVLTISMFAAMGAGMALPYLVLSAFPALVKHVPKAGPASELVKQVMGILLLAAGAFFLSTGLAGLFHWRGVSYYWIVAGLAAIAGAWLAYRTFGITQRTGRRVAFGGLGLIIVVLSLLGGRVMTLPEPASLRWTLYSQVAERTALDEGRIVVIKFTAHWCISCKALEKAMLTSTSVVDRLSQPDVELLTVDITGGEPEQSQRLKQAGSGTIPLILVIAPNGTSTLRSDFYTGQQVVDAVNAAAAIRPAVATR